MSEAATVRVPTRGPYDLAQLATFGFGYQDDEWDGVWRLAFVLDHGERQAGVELRQLAADEVELVVQGDAADVEGAVAQALRIASLDHDGDAFVALGERDPVLARLIAAGAGLRPPLFASPYEGAAWSILSARRGRATGRVLRRRLSEQAGRSFELAGRREWAMPTPEALLGVSAVQGVTDEQLRRLHGVAQAALDGDLDVEKLHELPEPEALRQLQRIRGIGSFGASLILVRASGMTDGLPLQEQLSRSTVQRLWGLPDPFTDERYLALAEGWRPFRTWVVVLARARGSLVG